MKKKNGIRCANSWFLRWIDSVQPQLHGKISLLLDEIPLSNQSQLNQTYFITQLPSFISRYPNLRSVKEDQNLAYNRREQGDLQRDRLPYRSIGLPLASILCPISFHLFSRPLLSSYFPRWKAVWSSEFPKFGSQIAYERTCISNYYFSFSFISRVFYEYPMHDFSSIVINFLLCKYCEYSNFYSFRLLFITWEFTIRYNESNWRENSFLRFVRSIFFDKWGKI